MNFKLDSLLYKMLRIIFGYSEHLTKSNLFAQVLLSSLLYIIRPLILFLRHISIQVISRRNNIFHKHNNESCPYACAYSYKHIFASLIKFPSVHVRNKGPSLSVLADDCSLFARSCGGPPTITHNFCEGGEND